MRSATLATLRLGGLATLLLGGACTNDAQPSKIILLTQAPAPLEPNTAVATITTTVTLGTPPNGVDSSTDVLWVEDLPLGECGDGIVEGSELCDDGNRIAGDGCNTYCGRESGWYCETPEPCRRVPFCGNRRLETGPELAAAELCDDGNRVSGDGCTELCQLEAGWDCSAVGEPCRRVGNCGDGVAEGLEWCDDGNLEEDDGCDALCRLEPGWLCPTPGAPCIADCTLSETNEDAGAATMYREGRDGGVLAGALGDDTLDARDSDAGARDAEARDAGVLDAAGWDAGLDAAGWDAAVPARAPDLGRCPRSEATTEAVPVCGPGEDPGDADCGVTAAVCGNGIVDEGEACDDGENRSRYRLTSSACGPGCQLPGYCRDGRVDVGFETCDRGSELLGEYGGCNADCTPAGYCGDGIINVNSPEQCDDGNTHSGDGCDPACLNERIFRTFR